MDEKFSSFLDGELVDSEMDAFLSRIKFDDKPRRSWDTYHLIGDAMRGQLNSEVASRVALRLAGEPVVMARTRSRYRGLSRQAFWPAMSAAAGIAAVMIVAFMALPGAVIDPPVVATPQTPNVAPPVAVAGKFDRYLLAHQRFSSSSTMQGVAPYVRTVSAGRNGSPK
ncbi:MAG: hypothetical protein EXR27_16975 [Betaproteobacteria bacterium]|nr:hypothetical protein [Betaproteobacteria bacterium]